jgi:hypothetical protein
MGSDSWIARIPPELPEDGGVLVGDEFWAVPLEQAESSRTATAPTATRDFDIKTFT